MPSDPLEVTGTLLEVATRYIERLMTTAGPRVVIDDSTARPVEHRDGRAPGRHDDPPPARGPRRLAHRPAPGVGRAVRCAARGPRACRRRDRAAGHPRRPGRPGCGRRPAHPRADRRQPAVRQRDRARLPRGRHARMAGRTHRAGRVDRPQDADHLRAVLGARIDALDPDARLALRVASVIGIRFDTTTVAWLLGTDPLSGAALDHLAASALIAPTEDGDWRFAHPLIHDAAYAGLLASRRRDLHSRMADLLEARPGPVPLTTVAIHRAAAGDAIERCRCCVRPPCPPWPSVPRGGRVIPAPRRGTR